MTRTLIAAIGSVAAWIAATCFDWLVEDRDR